MLRLWPPAPSRAGAFCLERRPRLGTGRAFLLSLGTADDFLDRYAALPSAARNSAGARPPSALLRLSVLYRPIQPPELLDEAGGGPARPVPAVPELPLEQAEEALHRRVVWAAALGGHAPGEAVPLADRNPAGPAVRKCVEIGTLKLRKSVKFDGQIIRKSVAG